ncbi:polysaccharide deacetylase family sporulation protein PdaB [Paenibacillus herberti]|uniref:Polysaccharide deacetylase family sporulation protein PdaB n=1 Tax=Paenibacillus herberti TaxID=1619309 RepID=A0A229NZA9_9BACL|nr:polysaccharide deacetylase family sporulation protein PdaB [Paenibacillus herberti]OXM15035.1 polysaccharide deacetylase family sporulation protein PdaB [Paenibacillus herberti]
MNFFYVFNGRKIRRYFFLFAAVIFAAGVIYTEKDNITVFATDQPAAIYNVPTSKKMIALTFDISWGDKRAEPIMQILKEKGIKNTTFFLSAPWVQTHPQMVKAIMENGWEIGSHGNKHDNYSNLSDEEIQAQLQTAHSILSQETGKAPQLIRLPNGDFDKRVLQQTESMGYKVIQWDTDSQDWMNIGTQNIVDRVIKRAHPGDIVLLHASDSAKQTHEALPAIIDGLRAQGYEFVSVSQLINQTEASGKEVRDNGVSTEPQPVSFDM